MIQNKQNFFHLDVTDDHHLRLGKSRLDVVEMDFFAVSDETDSGLPATCRLALDVFTRQTLQNALDVLAEEVDETGLDVVVRHVEDEHVGRRFGEDVVPAIVFCSDEFVRAQTQFRPLVLVHPHSRVVQVLEILGWNFGRRLAERAVESATAVDELHERAHVGFATAATDRAQFAQIDDRWLDFTFFQFGKRTDDEAERYGRLFHHVGLSWDTVKTI